MPSDELRFGTAGLRGPVRPGPGGMNVDLVARATWAVGEWLRSTGQQGGTVVVGRDGRHGSAEFFSTTTSILAAAGLDVVALPGLSPTPLVAFACHDLGAAAGIQITASHNPAADNGYKLYGGIGTDAPGAQIIAPVDAQIEAHMSRAPTDVPTLPVVPDARAHANRERYLARLADRFGRVEGPVRIALTALHGVGGSLALDALRGAGCDDVHVVDDQFSPDPDFPTVEFPNPEEPGATDRLLRLAADVDADLAVALDPDADRCALAIPDAGGWRQLTGDEVGGLFCTALAVPNGTVASSIVSGTLAADVAEAAGARSVRTLTGFKWLVRAGEPLVYAYEEAIGHCVDPTAVRDKDGISAALLAAQIAARLRCDGSSIATLLDELALRHGVHATVGRSLRLPPPTTSEEIMGRLRSRARMPLVGADLMLVDYATRTDELRTDAVEFVGELDGMRVRALVRPSGTEPKVKAYVEVVASVSSAARVADARSEASALAEQIATALLA